MANKKRRAPHKKRRHSVNGTSRRRHSRRRGKMGALPGNTGEKVIGIAAGSAGIMILEEMIMKKRPNMNPMLMGGGELLVGVMLSGNDGLEGYVGDGMIAAGAMNLVQALRKRRAGMMHGPEYVIQGPDYITGDPNEMYITDGGYVMNGAGEYLVDGNGEYITEGDLVMGDVNQGGLGGVNQGGIS